MKTYEAKGTCTVRYISVKDEDELLPSVKHLKSRYMLVVSYLEKAGMKDRVCGNVRCVL